MFVVPFARPSSLYRRDARLASLDGIVERLFDESLDRSRTRTPAMDVAESDTAYTISFDVPGASRDQLKVSVEGRRVTLASALPADKAAAQAAPETSASAETAKPVVGRVLYRERGSVAYARTVSLPAEVDQASSQARFDNGVLTLVLSKKVPAGATQLQIV